MSADAEVATGEEAVIGDELKAELMQQALIAACEQGAHHLSAAYEMCGLCCAVTLTESKVTSAGGIIIGYIDRNSFNRCEECLTAKRLHPQVYEWVERVILGRSAR